MGVPYFFSGNAVSGIRSAAKGEIILENGRTMGSYVLAESVVIASNISSWVSNVSDGVKNSGIYRFFQDQNEGQKK